MLKVHETGGKITTVSGDLTGTWGYAAELVRVILRCGRRAFQQKHAPPGEVSVPNRHLDLCEKLPIAGITNGMSETNGPEHLPNSRLRSYATSRQDMGVGATVRQPCNPARDASS